MAVTVKTIDRIVVNPKLPKVSKAKLISIHLGLVENYQPKSGLWSIPHVFIEITLYAALKGCSCHRKECCIWWSKELYSEPWYYIIIMVLSDVLSYIMPNNMT